MNTALDYAIVASGVELSGAGKQYLQQQMTKAFMSFTDEGKVTSGEKEQFLAWVKEKLGA